MPSYAPDTMPWHAGEERMHDLMHLPPQLNPGSPFLTPGAAYMLFHSPILSLGALDSENRPWTTVWGGESGFARPVAESAIDVRALVDRKYDPVAQALLGGGKDEESVDKATEGKMVGGLAIDLETRQRVKLYGRMLGGALVGKGKKSAGVGEARLVVRIDESLGNCPKYLNKKHIVPTLPKPELVSDSPQLPPQAVSLLEKADLFFISSSNAQRDMDSNHRGGPSGFVRLLSNSPSGAVIVYPEYSGNRLYQTLGNLQITPLAGITIPDFDTGDVLYLTGHTSIHVGPAASAILPRSNLAVTLTITRALYIAQGLSFRGIPGEPSPYNPSVRYTSTEKPPSLTSLSTAPTSISTAPTTLIAKTPLTPSISRFRFRLPNPSSLAAYKPGQHATLSFAAFLDRGYSHMRDVDPQSLNDDFVRTFTVSSVPSRTDLASGEFELTVRNVGRATGLLFGRGRGFEVPVLGFGGEFRVAAKANAENGDGGEEEGERSVVPFVAGGIGITALLGQLEAVDLSRLRLLWSVGVQDVGLVVNVLERYPGLVGRTNLFVTGDEEGLGEREKKLLGEVKGSGVRIERRRLEKGDIDDVNEEPGVKEWYMCVGPRLKATLLNWLVGRRVVYEDFNY